MMRLLSWGSSPFSALPYSRGDGAPYMASEVFLNTPEAQLTACVWGGERKAFTDSQTEVCQNRAANAPPQIMKEQASSCPSSSSFSPRAKPGYLIHIRVHIKSLYKVFCGPRTDPHPQIPQIKLQIWSVLSPGLLNLFHTESKEVV